MNEALDTHSSEAAPEMQIVYDKHLGKRWNYSNIDDQEIVALLQQQGLSSENIQGASILVSAEARPDGYRRIIDADYNATRPQVIVLYTGNRDPLDLEREYKNKAADDVNDSTTADQTNLFLRELFTCSISHELKHHIFTISREMKEAVSAHNNYYNGARNIGRVTFIVAQLIGLQVIHMGVDALQLDPFSYPKGWDAFNAYLIQASAIMLSHLKCAEQLEITRYTCDPEEIACREFEGALPASVVTLRYKDEQQRRASLRRKNFLQTFRSMWSNWIRIGCYSPLK